MFGLNNMHCIVKSLSNLCVSCITVTFSGLRGVRIMQQIVPFRQSTVDIHFSANLVFMTTENVARLCLKEPLVSPVRWHQRSVTIDGTVISTEKTQGKCSPLCSKLSHCLILSSHCLICSHVAGDGVALLSVLLGQGTLLLRGLSHPWIVNVYQQSVWTKLTDI